MYDEKKIEDSLRVCREIKTYYKSGVFDNPQNVFDLDTFLHVAETKPEDTKEKEAPDAFHERLQEAIDYGNAIRTQRKERPISEEPQKVFAPKEEPIQEKIQKSEDVVKEPTRKKNKTEKQKVKKAKEVEIQPEEEEEESFFKILFSRFLELVVCVLIAFGLSAAFNHFIGTHTIVEGASMESTLHDEDSLYVDKIAYRFGKPKRFDIIVFRYDEDNYYIKRIIGLPGETVEIKDGIIYINGNKLNENYGLENMDELNNTYDAVTIGEDEYYVLGDNRNHSTDSRSKDVGLVKKSQIIGKASYRIYPFDTFGKLK